MEQSLSNFKLSYLFSKTRLPILFYLVMITSLGCNKSPDLRAAELVCSTLYPTGEKKSVVIEMGELEGGYAVITGNDEVFWVFDNKVYSINDKAQRSAPSIPIAKASITEERAKAAAIAPEKQQKNHKPVNTSLNMDFVRTSFEGRLSKIAQEGLPSTIDDLSKWYPEPPMAMNAAEMYEKAMTLSSTQKVQLLFQAVSLDSFRYPIKWDVLSKKGVNIKVIMGFCSNMREITKFYEEAARGYTKKGDCENAQEWVTASLQLLRHMGNCPFILVQLTRYACGDIVSQCLEETLSFCDYSDAQLLAIDQFVVSSYCEEALIRAWISERVIYKQEDPFCGDSAGYLRNEARFFYILNQARIKLAAIRYKKSQNSAPSRIEDLIPTFLDTIPINPLSGTPMSLNLDENNNEQ